MTAWDALAARRSGVPVSAARATSGSRAPDRAIPGLLTLDALAGLAQADVVVHDALVDQRVLALAGPQARLEFAGKRGGKPSATQADISQRLVALARDGRARAAAQGRRSVRVRPRRRGGDDARCRRRAVSRHSRRHRRARGAGGGGIPATLRGINRAVIFAAGHGADEDFDWAPLARTGQPIVLYMVMHNLERIAAALMAAGLAPQTPAAVIASATTPKQRVLVSTLEKLAADAREQKFEPPAIVVIGEIVKVRAQLLGADAACAQRSRRDRARPHHRRAAFRRRQDHGDAGAAGGAGAARHRRARGESRPRLHRSGVPCRRHRRRQRQSRFLGHAGETARCLGRAGRRRRRDFRHRRRHGPVRRRAGAAQGRRGATADLAAHFGLPVVLVLDVARQAQSAAAVVRGFAAHDPAVRIAGVILNRVAQRAASRARRRARSRALGIPVLGARAARSGARAAGTPSRPGSGRRACRACSADRSPRRRWPSAISISTPSSARAAPLAIARGRRHDAARCRRPASASRSRAIGPSASSIRTSSSVAPRRRRDHPVLAARRRAAARARRQLLAAGRLSGTSCRRARRGAALSAGIAAFCADAAGAWRVRRLHGAGRGPGGCGRAAATPWPDCSATRRASPSASCISATAPRGFSPTVLSAAAARMRARPRIPLRVADSPPATTSRSPKSPTPKAARSARAGGRRGRVSGTFFHAIAVVREECFRALS